MRMHFPPPLKWKRAAAPLCVLSFGKCRFLFFLVYLRELGSVGTNDDVHIASFHLHRPLQHSVAFQVGGDPGQEATPQFRVAHLTAAEEDADLDLVPFLKQTLGLLHLHLEVVNADLWVEPDFSHHNVMLVLAGIPFLLGLFIAKTAVIKEPAHGGRACRCNFHQVHTSFSGNSESFLDGHDAQLLSIVGYYSDLTDPDLLIDT